MERVLHEDNAPSPLAVWTNINGMEVSLGVKLLSDIQPGTGHYYHKWSCHLVSEKQESTEKPAQNQNKSRLVPLPVRSTCLRRFYAALLLLILALTGLTWSFGWYRDAFYTAFGISTTSKQTHAPTSAVPPKTAGERGSKKHPKTDYTQWAEVLADLQSRYPEYKSISIQDRSATVSTAAYGNTRGSDRYSFDPATGKITEIQLYKDLPKSAKIRGWIYSVHAGTWED